MSAFDETVTTYQGYYARSIALPEQFWAHQAKLIEWLPYRSP